MTDAGGRRGGARHRDGNGGRLDVGVGRSAGRLVHVDDLGRRPHVPRPGVVRAGGGGTSPLAIETAVAEPEAISPNGDGQADTTTLTYRISAPANVTVEVTDEIGGVLATLVDRVWTRAGQHTASSSTAPSSPDGNYNVVVTARTAAGVSVQKVIPLSVNRTLGLVTVAPAAFSPNGDGRKDRLTLTFALAAPADVRIRIEREGRWVASPLVGSFLAGTQRFVWDGARAAGVLRDGEYTAVVEAIGGPGTIAFGVPFVSDTTRAAGAHPSRARATRRGERAGRC